MLFPLGTDRPLRRPPLITPLLIGATVACYLLQLVLSRSNPEQYEELLRSLAVWRNHFKPWTLVTSAFLHSDASPWHIIGNMLFLWVFGPNIEDRFGRIGFSLFYLFGAIASAAAHILVSANPAIGASGAVSACTGAYLVLFPRTQIKCFSLLGYIGIFRVSAWWFIILAIAWDILLQASGARTGIAHAAHLGGAAFGIAVAMSLLWLRLLPREPFDLFTMGRQAVRRRQFKEAGYQAAEANRQRWARAKGADGADECDALSAARADVTRHLNAGDANAAAAAYRALADKFGDKPGATTLARRYQYELANYLHGQRRFEDAAYAYERFLEGYPKDPEAPQIRLLLGLIYARELNDPVRAKALINEAIPRLEDESLELARRELANLG